MSSKPTWVCLDTDEALTACLAGDPTLPYLPLTPLVLLYLSSLGRDNYRSCRRNDLRYYVHVLRKVSIYIHWKNKACLLCQENIFNLNSVAVCFSHWSTFTLKSGSAHYMVTISWGSTRTWRSLKKTQYCRFANICSPFPFHLSPVPDVRAWHIKIYQSLHTHTKYYIISFFLLQNKNKKINVHLKLPSLTLTDKIN